MLGGPCCPDMVNWNEDRAVSTYSACDRQTYQSRRQALLFGVKSKEFGNLLLEGLSLLLQSPHFAGHVHHFSRKLFLEFFNVIWVTRVIIPSRVGVARGGAGWTYVGR